VISETQGRRPEMGSERSVEQTYEPMYKNRIRGIRCRTSWQLTTKSISIKGTGCKPTVAGSSAACRSSSCAAYSPLPLTLAGTVRAFISCVTTTPSADFCGVVGDRIACGEAPSRKPGYRTVGGRSL